jgi:hypothetical protein
LDINESIDDYNYKTKNNIKEISEESDSSNVSRINNDHKPREFTSIETTVPMIIA